MRRGPVGWTIGVLVTLLAVPSLATPQPVAFLGDLAEALELAQGAERPILVHLSATWCEPCHTMKEELYTRPEIRAALKAFVRVEVDVESERGKALWMAYGVDGLPTVLLLSPDGHEMKELRLTTVPEPDDLRRALERAAEPESWPASDSFEGEGPLPSRKTQILWFVGCVLLLISMFMKFKQRAARESRTVPSLVRPRPLKRFRDEDADVATQPLEESPVEGGEA